MIKAEKRTVKIGPVFSCVQSVISHNNCIGYKETHTENLVINRMVSTSLSCTLYNHAYVVKELIGYQ